MDNQKLMIQTIKESLVLERKKIELNNKFQKTPFYIPKPHSTTDMNLLCEVMHPTNFLKDWDGEEEIDFVGAVLFDIEEHDDLTKDKESNLHQIELFTNKVVVEGYKYLKRTKFKLLDPHTELYRNRFKPSIKKYLKLNKIPEYLSSHFKNLLEADKSQLDAVHNNFWHKVFSENREAHFIKWQLNQQNIRNRDIFIPPVPFINSKSRNILIDYAIKINSYSLELVGETSATYFPIDIQLFRHRDFIKKITEYLSYINTKFNFFKIYNSEKIIEKGFGQDARKNFEFFLKVINSLKEEDPTKVFGILNGGGFGYCLIGGGFDFYVDNVNNYGDSFVRSGGKRPTHRKMLNEETMSLEPFEGMMNMLNDDGTLIGNNEIINKYKGKKQNQIKSKEWSEDCRKHGILTWNGLTKIAVRSINENEDSLYFDKVLNSDYAILGNIIRNIR